eukprot:scaffold42123_cov78-Phaeocystis_antarctica.AAC.3
MELSLGLTSPGAEGAAAAVVAGAAGAVATDPATAAAPKAAGHNSTLQSPPQMQMRRSASDAFAALEEALEESEQAAEAGAAEAGATESAAKADAAGEEARDPSPPPQQREHMQPLPPRMTSDEGDASDGTPRQSPSGPAAAAEEGAAAVRELEKRAAAAERRAASKQQEVDMLSAQPGLDQAAGGGVAEVRDRNAAAARARSQRGGGLDRLPSGGGGGGQPGRGGAAGADARAAHRTRRSARGAADTRGGDPRGRAHGGHPRAEGLVRELHKGAQAGWRCVQRLPQPGQEEVSRLSFGDVGRN